MARLQPQHVYFANNENKIKVFIHNPNNNVTYKKGLKFFWGKNYSIQTDVCFWDKANHRFKEYSDKKGKYPILSAQSDNAHLTSLQKTINTILEITQCETPEDLYTAYYASLGINAKATSKKQTLLEYAIYYRNLWKSGKCTKYESGNFVIYDKFIHKLQGTHKGKTMPWSEQTKKFANMPIADIDTEVFKKWCKLSAKIGGYKDNVKTFRAVVYHFQKQENDKPQFRFEYSTNTDNPNREEKKGIEVLTEIQLKQLFTFDVSLIKPRMKDSAKRLYIDTCILMYGLYSRPIDILSMRIEDIKPDRTNNGYVWKYCPLKKVNNHFEKEEDRKYGVPIDTACWAIIQKYIKGRKFGYVLPFHCNKEEKGIIERKAPTNHIATNIGKFMQDIAKYYNWDIKPIMYTLRHTVITNLIKHNTPIEKVAVLAKTSSKQIEQTYLSKEDAIRNFDTSTVFKGILI